MSPAQKQELEDRIKSLPDADQKRLENYVEQLSPAERDKLVEAVQAELKGHGRPFIQHVPEGPGIPPSYVLDFASYTDTTAAPLNVSLGRLTEAVRKIAPNMVVFRRKAVDKFSDGGVGNGVLVSKTLVLTARHVADAIAARGAK